MRLSVVFRFNSLKCGMLEKASLGMFSFEAHVKLLSLFAILVPLIFLVTLGTVRLWYYSHNEKFPKWIKFLNQDVLTSYDPTHTARKTSRRDSGTELLLIVLYYSYISFKIILGFFLWNATTKKDVKKLCAWILICGAFILYGYLLLNPMKRHRIMEVGLGVVYTKVSSIYSVYTIILVSLLIVKIKHRHILNPESNQAPQTQVSNI